jgi:hypothetical protein
MNFWEDLIFVVLVPIIASLPLLLVALLVLSYVLHEEKASKQKK